MTRKITIPEGFNIYQIADKLDDNEITSSGKFLYYAFDRDFLKSLKIFSSSAEGYLFPDTYVFAESSDPRDVIAVLHNQMKKVLSDTDRDRLREVNFNYHELLIMASLIEEEAKVASERKYISSVYHNRLRRDMKLDCDPTVRYAKKKFTGRLTYHDLEYESPYNTYRNKGLPPTPICSPGSESIKAAANPAHSDFLYFVARKDGSHYFSKTLRQHNKAVRFHIKGKNNGFVDNQVLK